MSKWRDFARVRDDFAVMNKMQPLDTRKWVPHAPSGWSAGIEDLSLQLAGYRICLLTGAGCSTESGIPDYRGEGTARRARNPIVLKQFLGSAAGRRRYWARSMIGWPRFRSAQPNDAHTAAARLERAGLLSGTITQNVDRLHTRAGSKYVTELHGALEEVTCIACGTLEHRDDLQSRLCLLNPTFLDQHFEIAPDGDADIAEELIQSFQSADCQVCGGVLKPRVVFFGEGVPQAVVDAAWQSYEDADALLVVGSSLTVFSGFRFVRRAAKDQKPLYVVNVGATRADEHARGKVCGPAGPALALLAKRLAPTIAQSPTTSMA
jgi:NAD-dependent SIR2 family protein deacetylase